jgi:hypothetical protein
MSTPQASRLGRVRQVLFEQGVSRLIFEHARNLVVAMLVLAVGMEATKHDPSEIGILYFRSAGYLVAAIGVLLMLLNLAEGLHRLAKVRLPGAWQVLLLAIYVVLFWRVAQLVLLFR